jgi:hypothetical protein
VTKFSKIREGSVLAEIVKLIFKDVLREKHLMSRRILMKTVFSVAFRKVTIILDQVDQLTDGQAFRMHADF